MPQEYNLTLSSKKEKTLRISQDSCGEGSFDINIFDPGFPSLSYESGILLKSKEDARKLAICILTITGGKPDLEEINTVRAEMGLHALKTKKMKEHAKNEELKAILSKEVCERIIREANSKNFGLWDCFRDMMTEKEKASFDDALLTVFKGSVLGKYTISFVVCTESKHDY